MEISDIQSASVNIGLEQMHVAYFIKSPQIRDWNHYAITMQGLLLKQNVPRECLLSFFILALYPLSSLSDNYPQQ